MAIAACLGLTFPVTSMQNADEAALSALVEKFFAASAQEDLDGFMALWSVQSPEYVARRQAMQQFFAQRDRIEVKNLTVRKMEVDGDKARVRVAVELNAVDATTGKPTPVAKTLLTFYCIKEEGTWKVWSYVPTASELAAAWAAAKTDEEKHALLTADREVTLMWAQAIIADVTHLVRQNDYVQALKALQFAQDVTTRIDDKAGIARILSIIGEVHRLRGDYASALASFEKSLAQLEASGTQAEKEVALLGLGNVHTALGNYSAAMEFFEKSRALAETTGNKVIAARNLGNASQLYFAQGNYAQALKFLQRSLQASETIGDKEAIAIDLLGIGNVHAAQGNAGLAMEFFQKSLAQFEALQHKAGVLNVLSSMGSLSRIQEDYKQAMEWYQKSLTLANEVGNKSYVALVLSNIGHAHAMQGDHAKAIEFYQQALTLQKETGDKAGEATTLQSLAHVASAQGNHALSLTFAQQAADLAKTIGNAETLWRARSTAGMAHLALKQFDQAHQDFQEATTIIEEMRHQVAGDEQAQQRFFENKLHPYHGMMVSLLAQNKTGDALTYAERAKARVLLDVLHSGKVNVTKSMTETEREQERALNHQLVSLNTQIFRESQRKQPDENRLADLRTQLHKARLDYEAFQTTLYAAHPQLKVQRGQAKPLTLEETNALLPDAKTALLEFVVTEGKTYLFVLSSPEPQTQNLKPLLKVYPIDIPQKDLAERVTRLREMVAARRSGFPRLARELYDRLLKPAQAQQQGKTHLVIIPDGVLWELPFQALQVKENRYLIEDAAISYAPSLTVLREMQKVRLGVGAWGRGGNKNTPSRPTPPTPPPTLLAFGNPSLGKGTVERVHLVHRGENLNPLPEAEKEVKDLRQLYGATRCKVYVGADAREERVKSEGGNYRILHFATHGFVNDRSPMYSQVVLAQVPSSSPPLSPAREGSEDGLLEAWEILNLDLQADLVVLSACETARGRVSAGEGVIGLTWGLFVAGCPTTVVSQWKVADASTRQLMVEFHRQLRAQSKVEALRQAQLKLMKDGKHNHPFYWAAFVLVGDGR